MPPSWAVLQGLLFSLLFFSFCTKSRTPIGFPEGITDSTAVKSLEVDSIRVDSIRTDTLTAKVDTSDCPPVFTVEIFLSKTPERVLPWICNYVDFENLGNPRFTCYECLSLNTCPETGSIPYASIFESIITLKIVQDTSLGFGPGSCLIVIDSLFDVVISDSTRFSDTLFLYWN